jgi:hypothetical protein
MTKQLDGENIEAQKSFDWKAAPSYLGYGTSLFRSSRLTQLTSDLSLLQILPKNSTFRPHHLKSHRHSTSMMPQNMTMKQPNPFIIGMEANNNIPFRRDVDSIFSNRIAEIVWSTTGRL